MSENKFNTYDFIVNDDDEVMLLIYAQTGTPSNPHLEIDIQNKRAVLYRTADYALSIDDIPDEISELFYDLDKILVCELSAEQNDDDTQITDAYEATITVIP